MPRPPDPGLRQRLVAAARLEFGSHGFVAASLERIARLAAVTKGGVYFHFRSKEALFFAAVDDARSEIRALLDEPAAGGAAGQLQELLKRLLGYHFRHPEVQTLLGLTATELRGGFTAEARGDAQAELRALRARLRVLFARGQRDGSLRVADPALAAFLVASTLAGVLEHRRLAGREIEAFGGADSLAAAIVAPYLGSASTRSSRAPVAESAEVLRPPF